MDIWIGTSGYSYSSWVGDFYPAGTKSNKMLAYYGRHFPLVELNFTFYRVPTPEMLRRHAEQTPPGFRFLVKLPQTISHDEAQLSDWIDALPGGGPGEALFLFNNCQRSQAVVNARRMRALLEERAPQFHVVAPFAEAPPVQRSLFE